jgi:hypothetical protein
MSRRGEAAVVAVWLAVAVAGGGCASFARESAQDTENLLAAAGFTMKPADTPMKPADTPEKRRSGVLGVAETAGSVRQAGGQPADP